MNPNAEPLEILRTLLALAGFAVAIACLHYARLDRQRLRRSGSNGVLEGIAAEAVERDATRLALFALLVLVGIVLMLLPGRVATEQPLVAAANWLHAAVVTLLLVSAARTLTFRLWLLLATRPGQPVSPLTGLPIERRRTDK